MISDVQVADNEWKKKIINKVHVNYLKAPYYSKYCDDLYEIIDKCESDCLADINFSIFMYLMKLLEIQVDVIISSRMQIQSTDPTGRLVEICKKIGASAYIAGRGGMNYLNLAAFENENIKVIWQDFDPQNVVYPQVGNEFLAGLSIIDCLFNAGAEKARKLTGNAWKIA